MNKNTLKSIIELQAEKIEELKELVKGAKAEIKNIDGWNKDLKQSVNYWEKEAEGWRVKWEDAMENLESKEADYQNLKRNYNLFKDKNENLVIANGRLIKANKELEGLVKEKNESIMISNETFQKELKEVEIRYEKKIDGMSKSYGEEIENLLKQMRDKSC